MNACRDLLAATALVAGLVAQVAAAPLVLAPTHDASIFTGVPGSDVLADGQGPFLWLSTTAEGLARRALLRFDVSSVPPGAVVRSARLVLFETRSRANHVVTLHRLQQSWSEGPANAGSQGAGAPAVPGDVTWTHRNHGSLPWLAAGGDFVATASAQLLVGAANQDYAWGSTPAMVADVQGWVDQPATNHGWVLVGDETTQQSAKQLVSRADGTTINVSAPRLELEIDPPPAVADTEVPVPGWALGVLGLGLAALLRRSRRA